MNSSKLTHSASLPNNGVGGNKALNPEAFFWPVLLGSEEVKSSLAAAGNDFFRVISSDDELLEVGERALSLKLGGLVLYERPQEKSEDAKASLLPEGRLPRALTLLRNRFPELHTIADLCVCQYTEDGHCRLHDGDALSDAHTVDHLSKQAALYSQAGASGLMPSAMLPLFSVELRRRFSDQGMEVPMLISQSAKFHSGLYYPFRNSLCMASKVDKQQYQLKPDDIESALSAISAEQEGGADIALIKPALPYLGLLEDATDLTEQRCGVFLTSGEHVLLLSLGEREGDRLKYLKCATESLLNAGAVAIVTYLAPELVDNRLSSGGISLKIAHRMRSNLHNL